MESIRKQYKNLRNRRRDYGVQAAVRDAVYIAPDLEIRHPPSSGQPGWWQPGRLQARAIGSTGSWREI